MVDYESYSQYGPQDAPLGSIITGEYDDLICGCNDCKDSERLAEECRFYFDGKKGHEDWTAEQFMLCPPRVLGYILGTKQWAQLHIGNLQSSESRYHQDTWDNKLQLAGEGSGSNTKNLLMNLVKSHGDPLVQNKLQDIVAEKGRGLVILLHGMYDHSWSNINCIPNYHYRTSGGRKDVDCRNDGTCCRETPVLRYGGGRRYTSE